MSIFIDILADIVADAKAEKATRDDWEAALDQVYGRQTTEHTDPHDTDSATTVKTMIPIDASAGLDLDDLRPLSFGDDADYVDDERALLRHVPGEWTGTMNPLIIAAMRDLLEEAPVRMTIKYCDEKNNDVRVSGELVALTTTGYAVLVGGIQGHAPTQRVEIPIDEIHLLAF